VVAAYSGLNTSAAVSPDGSKVAMVLSKMGSPNVWVCNADGTGLTRVTKGVEDSSPCWSPDGQWICFAAKINARRVLAKVPAEGGPIQRLIAKLGINPTEPDWSPDGKQAIMPAEKYEKQSNSENGELYPVFPFCCFGLALGSAEIVDWTMKHRTCKDSFGCACWTQDQIDWACAGNATEAALPVLIASGITGVRDMGSPSFETLRRWRVEALSGARIGPRIVAPGPILRCNPPDSYHLLVCNPEQARRALQTALLIDDASERTGANRDRSEIAAFLAAN